MAGELVGVDIGGTFTDFVVVDEQGQVRVHKRLTTPKDPSRALLAGVEELGLASGEEVGVVHGSTIATNALLEGKGARTALITTRGFVDLLEIGRQTRPNLYALHPQKPKPLVPPEWRFEVTERVAADGTVLIPLDPGDLDSIIDRLWADGIESVAVCLLFSFLYPAHERAVRERLVNDERLALVDERADAGEATLDPGHPIFVSLSCEVLPEFREYERTSTTVINAAVAPLMGRYLSRLDAGLDGRRLRIMQSNGGVISAVTASAQAARTVLSGPAGGAVGAFHVAQLSGYEQVITFDMGGTSTDVALCDGGIPTTTEGDIGEMPLRLPMIDIHTVGAGGGSLAQVDAGGALTVGPQSAGADPGPICYAKGGTVPTTTDAHLVLGRLDADHFLGGGMALDIVGARAAMEALARSMGAAGLERAAWGVLRVANATMERAIRRISVERGHDPRRFALLAFGGAGPLHACDLASALSIPTVLVPRTPGVLSALGMLVADLVKDYSQTVMLRIDRTGRFDGPSPVEGERAEAHNLNGSFQPLKQRGRRDLIAEGVKPDHITFVPSLDMRYAGQSHELTVPVPADGDVVQAFHQAHQRRYGHQHPEEPVEIVNVRIAARGALTKPRIPVDTPTGRQPDPALLGYKKVFFGQAAPERTALYERQRLRAGNRIPGPAIVFQLDTTTVIPPGWQAHVDPYHTLVITQQ